jgi:hypothetical protein
MQCLFRLFTCGKFHASSSIKERFPLEMRGFVSEETQPGESPGESHFIGSNEAKQTGEFLMSFKKKKGELLGLKLFHSSLQIQSISRGCVVALSGQDIPIGAAICAVNGMNTSIATIKQQLRECRDLEEVVLTVHFAADETLPRSVKRESHSSVASSNVLSPSPSQLSSMWRRVSETGSLPVSSEGVVPIDFHKLTKDSMGMWTRNGSLPDCRTGYGESPTSTGRVKRASYDGIYTNRIHN